VWEVGGGWGSICAPLTNVMVLSRYRVSLYGLVCFAKRGKLWAKGKRGKGENVTLRKPGEREGREVQQYTSRG